MADIQTYLDYILSKVYGKDVRQAIVDAINQCYTDATAGITPVITTEQIAGGTKFTVTVGSVSTSFDVMNGISPQVATANTASAMTDTDLIYIYTGSETGYVNGDWYYYDGTAWQDGGQYQSTVPAIDSTLTVTGAAADAKKVGDEISDLRSAISGGGLTADIKQALMDFANAVAFKGDDPTGQTYIDALEDALYPPADLVSISAVYTQSGTVYNTDSLDSLKADLVVTATWSDSSTSTVASADYTLSGTLTVGTSTITVTYGGKTTTFNVTVSSDGLIYSLVDHVFDGTINTQVDSGVKLLETDQSFTILAELTGGAQQSSPTWRLLHCMDTNARGINFGYSADGGLVERWMAVYETMSSGFASFTGSKKVVVTHESGTNSATYMVKLGTNAVSTKTISDSAFYPNATTLYIGGSPGNNRALTGTGTVKIYDSVLSQAKINEFLGV